MLDWTANQMKANSRPLQEDMSMEMEAISFYGTLGAIILLQISFYWLFRDDHYRRQMSQDEIGQQRLLILLAGPSESFRVEGEEEEEEVGAPDDAASTSSKTDNGLLLLWRRRLEQIGFIIYELRLDEQLEQLSFNKADRVIRIAAGKQDHIDRAVGLIGRELKLNEQKLHAFVGLPRRPASSESVTRSEQNQNHDESKLASEMNQDGRGKQKQQKRQQQQQSNNKLINLIRDDQLQSYRLLSALSPILNHNSRIIQVQSQPVQPEASDTANATTMVEQSSVSLDDGQASLSSLQLDIETLVNDYLRSELARSNRGQLIEVVSRQPAQEVVGQQEQLSNLDETNPTKKGNKSISEKCACTSKLYDELQKLLVLVNPRDRIQLY